MDDLLTAVETSGRSIKLIDLAAGCARFGADPATLPYSLRVLLENALRRGDLESAERIATRRRGEAVGFLPSRVLLHDLLGIPLLVDLSSMRDAAKERGAAPEAIKPRLPVDLVIDHSLIPYRFGSEGARMENEALELKNNHERFRFLHWCQSSFDGVRIVPPGKGILHQINVEYLAQVYLPDEETGIASPDTVYGTDSHTPMVNGLGVVGWGVGGLEAEMAMLGRETTFPVPDVVGVRLSGELQPGVTATDLVLTVTQRLRALGVVAKFVEFCGESLGALSAADRCTIANMAPEYGATCVYFPIDGHTIDYLALSGRDPGHVALVQACARAQGLWRDAAAPTPAFDETIDIDLAAIEPSIAGPRRPEDRIALKDAHENLDAEFPGLRDGDRFAVAGTDFDMGDGDVAVAAITSCTNTSNPAVIIGAALLARNAVERGLSVKPWIKTTFAPGSQVVAAYLEKADLQRHLDALGFNVVGFGCTTCNGASGPLPDPIRETIERNDLTCVAALSGNRNFEGRVHPNCRANYIMSPPLVVAYALAGSIRKDIHSGPIGTDADGAPVFLKDIWPDDREIAEVTQRAVTADLFEKSYAAVLRGGEGWDALGQGGGTVYDWDADSTYIRRPPFLDGVEATPAPTTDLFGLRPLVMLGDSITTDHISPSGAIMATSAAGQYLQERGTGPADFNTYGTRRGNYEVAMRSSFANIRLHNEMIPGIEGSLTRLMPEGRDMSVFDAAVEYQSRGVDLVVIAGKEYGCGSSRDTAAKCVALLGVKAVIAESFERIHRTNLVGMGILPLQFADGQTRQSLGLTGAETFDILGIEQGLSARCTLTLVVAYADGRRVETPVLARLDTPAEAATVEGGGVLPAVFRDMVYAKAAE